MLKLNIISNNELEIYLYYNICNIDFKDEESIVKFLKKLFVKLDKYYDLKIEGYYDINIFIDEFYGIVLKLKKEDFEYYDYYDKQVDLKITVNNNRFVFLLKNYDILNCNCDIYNYLNNIYLLPKEKLSYIEIANLMELTEIIYNSKDILSKGMRMKS